MCCIAKVGNELLIATENITLNSANILNGQSYYTGAIQLSGFGKAGNAKLVEVKVIEKQTSTTKPDLQLVLSDATITGLTQGSLFTSAIAAENFQAVAEITTADYKNISSGVEYASVNFDQNVVADGTGTLYLAVIGNTNTHNFTSATLTLKLVFNLFEC